uniref:Uncharacterized protein n=1 Tax=Anopheles merus TaxID=30066 RepID=A0A182USH7_ANOME
MMVMVVLLLLLLLVVVGRLMVRRLIGAGRDRLVGAVGRRAAASLRRLAALGDRRLAGRGARPERILALRLGRQHGRVVVATVRAGAAHASALHLHARLGCDALRLGLLPSTTSSPIRCWTLAYAYATSQARGKYCRMMGAVRMRSIDGPESTGHNCDAPGSTSASSAKSATFDSSSRSDPGSPAVDALRTDDAQVPLPGPVPPTVASPEADWVRWTSAWPPKPAAAAASSGQYEPAAVVSLNTFLRFV